MGERELARVREGKAVLGEGHGHGRHAVSSSSQFPRFVGEMHDCCYEGNELRCSEGLWGTGGGVETSRR